MEELQKIVEFLLPAVLHNIIEIDSHKLKSCKTAIQMSFESQNEEYQQLIKNDHTQVSQLLDFLIFQKETLENTKDIQAVK